MDGTDHDPGAFADELAALKRRGCALLVVGPAAGTSRCADLLGEDDRDRKRLVVDASHAPGDDRSLVHARVHEVRSTGAITPTPGTGPEPGGRDLDALADELTGRIARIAADGVAPGELRVCFGDLAALGSGRGDELVAFLEAVTDRVREASGVGHGHLPDTSPLRAEIELLFDVTVEVRPVPGGRQQRWLLHDAGLDSGWLAVDA